MHSIIFVTYDKGLVCCVQTPQTRDYPFYFGLDLLHSYVGSVSSKLNNCPQIESVQFTMGSGLDEVKPNSCSLKVDGSFNAAAMDETGSSL